MSAASTGLLERPVESRPVGMSPIVRTWLAFAALGAGMVHLAMLGGAPWPIAVPLGALGLAELAWGVAGLSRGEPVAPRLTVAVASAPVFGWIAVLLWSSVVDIRDAVAALTPIPMAVATLLDLVLAAALARYSRARRAAVDAGAVTLPARDAFDVGPVGRYLVALFAGALAVAALVLPALAATEAGRSATPHGTVDVDHHR